MIDSFSLECPRQIFFGMGSREKLIEILKLYGKNVFVITGSTWFADSGWKNKIKALLKNFHVEFFSCPKGEPTIESINTIMDALRLFSPDVIVGIGGGTVLDSAKAVSGLLSAEDPLEDYLEGIGKGLQLKKSGIPWIALPTTSGTGAEVTKNAVIRSVQHKVKKSLRSPYLLADVVIVDPEFTIDLPLFLSGISGMDAFVQLLESYVSKKAKPVPGALAGQALPVMLHALKKIPMDPFNADARTQAAYGSLVSGLALANSGLGAVHGFASAFGGLYDIPHGLICALFLGPVLKVNAPVIRNDIKKAFRDLIDPANEDPVTWIINEINDVLKLYDITPHLKNYNIDPAMIETLAHNAAGSSMSGNPKELTMEEKKKIILEVIS